MKNLLLMLAGAATICFYGCDNDDDDAANTVEPTASRTEMISSTDWMMESAVMVENGQTVDLLAAQPETAQDDVFKFEESGKAIREEGATREVGNSDVVDTGTWSFMNEEQDLKVDLKSMPVNDQIVELTRDRLVVRKFDGTREAITTFQREL